MIKCQHYKTWWDKNKEWNVELPKREFAEAVAASSTWVAVATTEHFIRFFSTGGAQIQIISIPGQVVTVSANQEQLFYTYHRGEGFFRMRFEMSKNISPYEPCMVNDF